MNAARSRETIASSHRAEILVIGSGPGGSITAAYLAEAGRSVLLVEEGPNLQLESCEPFSLDEMVQKYRNGGLTPALGTAKVAYVEGRCVGGGSEINSGLYHRTPPDVLAKWKAEFGLEAASPGEMETHFQAGERDVSVSYLPGPAPAASLKLHEGAGRLGWKSMEVPRWFRHEAAPDGSAVPKGVRQSMTKTFVPRALAAGTRLLPETRVLRLRRDGSGWLATASRLDGSGLEIRADHVFVCGGAVQTPALLRRSGITENIGNSLQLHPTVKIAAGFAEDVNSREMGVPVHQVKEFSPRLSFGCSISSAPFLAMGLIDHPAQMHEAANWRRMAIYYAMITPEGRGTVRTLPGFRDPLVRYKLTDADLRNLADGVRKLGEALLAADATVLFPAFGGAPVIRTQDELQRLPNVLPAARSNLMTIHLFSSCPMGENRKACAADSFGRVFGQPNLYIADGSLLCTAPGVNPQGSIMAFARRNVLKFLGKT